MISNKQERSETANLPPRALKPHLLQFSILPCACHPHYMRCLRLTRVRSLHGLRVRRVTIFFFFTSNI